MSDKKYNNFQIHKALKTVLSINYNFRWLDLEISPRCVNWYVAVQFRNDKGRVWLPRIISFYPDAQKVVVMCKLNDPDPTYVSAETIITMANIRAQTPPPPPVPTPRSVV